MSFTKPILNMTTSLSQRVNVYYAYSSK